MAIFPTTQDVTQFLGSSVGKPTDFNPAQQNPSMLTPKTNPQQNQPMPPSPYMPSGGPYNPYMSQWKQLMGGPSGQSSSMPGNAPMLPSPSSPGMTSSPSSPGMRPNLSSMMPAGINPSMMQGLFNRPMVR